MQGGSDGQAVTAIHGPRGNAAMLETHEHAGEAMQAPAGPQAREGGVGWPGVQALACSKEARIKSSSIPSRMHNAAHSFLKKANQVDKESDGHSKVTTIVVTVVDYAMATGRGNETLVTDRTFIHASPSIEGKIIEYAGPGSIAPDGIMTKNFLGLVQRLHRERALLRPDPPNGCEGMAGKNTIEEPLRGSWKNNVSQAKKMMIYIANQEWKEGASGDGKPYKKVEYIYNKVGVHPSSMQNIGNIFGWIMYASGR